MTTVYLKHKILKVKLKKEILWFMVNKVTLGLFFILVYGLCIYFFVTGSIKEKMILIIIATFVAFFHYLQRKNFNRQKN